MPPEMLPRFYQAFHEGRGDFINGSRLVYPMEGDAMRFLNRLGNVFFAKSLSWVLGVRLRATRSAARNSSRGTITSASSPGAGTSAISIPSATSNCSSRRRSLAWEW